jgi:predicted metal-dependent peptidase
MRNSFETLGAFKERLVLARSRLLRHEPFLGYMTLELPTHVLDAVDGPTPSAATDGNRYYYNYRWCRHLTDAELVFVIAHEVMHVILLHMLRRNNRQAKLWNAACDFAVNGILLNSCDEEGSLRGVAAMPSTLDAKTGRPQRIGLWDEQFADWTAESIYDELERNATDVGVNWDQILEPSSQKNTAAAEAQARAAVAKALIRAREHRQRHGGEPGRLERLAELALTPTVPWQQRLRQRALTWGFDTISWGRPNPRFCPHGLYLPRHRGYQLPNILFAFDTSGSVSDQFLGQMVSELNGLLLLAHNSVVRVVCCDTEVQVIGDFRANRRLDPQKHKLRGGGGTDFRPVFEYAERQKGFRQLIYLTDACGTYPETAPRKFDTLWLVPHDITDDPPFGEIVKMPFSVHHP